MKRTASLLAWLIFIPSLVWGACDSQTVLMLHGNGTDASTTITDDSLSAHACVANGDAQIDTAQSQFGGASILFDGTGDYVSIADGSSSSDYDFGTGDWTIEFWIRWNSVGNVCPVDMGSGIGGNGITVRYSNTNTRWELYFQGSEISDTSMTFTPSTNTWYNVLVSRSGTSVKLFVDGTQVGNTFTNSTDIQCTAAVQIGRRANNTELMNGWIDEVRFSKGIARQTSNFTKQSVEFCPSTATEVMRELMGCC